MEQHEISYAIPFSIAMCSCNKNENICECCHLLLTSVGKVDKSSLPSPEKTGDFYENASSCVILSGFVHRIQLSKEESTFWQRVNPLISVYTKVSRVTPTCKFHHIMTVPWTGFIVCLHSLVGFALVTANVLIGFHLSARWTPQ